jgi:hypothetical protein
LWLDFLLNGYKTDPAGNVTNEAVPEIIEPVQKIEEPIGPDLENFIKGESEITESIREEVTQSNLEIPIPHPEQLDEPAADSIENPGEEPMTSITGPVHENDAEINKHDTVVSAEEHVAPEQQTHTEEMPTEENPEKESGSSDQHVLEEKIDIGHPLFVAQQEPSKTDITFQPYYTVDYFASQGIRFIPEERPTDRFAKQLKSFTEWLRDMKKLPQAEIVKLSDHQTEEKVQELADHSISEKEVVTEAMAEVWAKQGNKEKAIDTYNKLSLLNPDKWTYFASLAEQVKNS